MSLFESARDRDLDIIGWREWATLPQLGINRIKAKVDTGARTSALHAFDVEYFETAEGPMVRFKAHPLQRDTSMIVEAIAPMLEQRQVRNSGGQVQERPVILTTVSFGHQPWEIELTLTNRDVMGFRMLLGREAVRRRFLVDPGASYRMSDLNRTPADEIDEPDLP
ncbi:MAG: RimK/LysX family protein [Cyanobacteria bacterium P01_D01_bin.71]